MVHLESSLSRYGTVGRYVPTAPTIVSEVSPCMQVPTSLSLRVSENMYLGNGIYLPFLIVWPFFNPLFPEETKNQDCFLTILLRVCVYQVLGYRKERDDLNEAYHQKLEENERAAEERTAKKRKKGGE